ncbi:MAG: nitrous oxide reductase accessory protein NosL [Sphingobacteriales bacterium]
MKKLSTGSRILLGFASLALIGTYFVPLWRIDLFAPQYPEGLTMKIWLTKLSGDVDIINGLNHYIGMKKINIEMFPEFNYLVYIVAFYILLGLIAAFTGSRKFLFTYLILSVIGAALAMYDFYQWGYDYGHNLNPDAPIKVPGMGYQPPLVGHRKLLNFDAYSMPDIGGWIVIIAGVLAFAVFIIAWYKQRKRLSKTALSAALTGIIFLFASCSTNPHPISYGKDNCYTCKMGFVDPKFGGEVITTKGKVYMFDDVICMVRFLKSGSIEDKNISKKVLVNYQKENDFIDADKAYFLVSPGLKTPMNSNAAAFVSQTAAEKLKSSTDGKVLLWDEVYSKIQ